MCYACSTACVQAAANRERQPAAPYSTLFRITLVSSPRSGAQKLSTFNLSTGGPTMEFMAPKLDQALASIEKFVGQSLDVPKVEASTCTAALCSLPSSLPSDVFAEKQVLGAKLHKGSSWAANFWTGVTISTSLPAGPLRVRVGCRHLP